MLGVLGRMQRAGAGTVGRSADSLKKSRGAQAVASEEQREHNKGGLILSFEARVGLRISDDETSSASFARSRSQLWLPAVGCSSIAGMSRRA
jgi:hypothetical protein